MALKLHADKVSHVIHSLEKGDETRQHLRWRLGCQPSGCYVYPVRRLQYLGYRLEVLTHVPETIGDHGLGGVRGLA